MKERQDEKFQKENKSKCEKRSQKKENCKIRRRRKKSQNVDKVTKKMLILMYKQERKETYECWLRERRGERTARERKGRAGSWQNCNL